MRGKIQKQITLFILIVLAILPLSYLSSCKKEVIESEAILCVLEDDLVNDKFKISWGKRGIKYETFYTINGKQSQNNPNLNYCLFDASTPADITIEIAESEHKENKATVHFKIMEPITYKEIEAIKKNNKVEITIQGYDEKYTLNTKINDTVQKFKQASFTLDETEIKNKKLSISKRYESKDENNGVFNFEASNYSTPLQIEVANTPTISFKPVNSNQYLIKSSGEGDFDSYDVKITTPDQTILEQKDVKSVEMATKCLINAKDLPSGDISLSLYCHGDKNNKHIICDTQIEKTIKYKANVTYQMENEKLTLEQTENMIGYELTKKGYIGNTSKQEQIQTNVISNLAAGEYYDYEYLPIYADDTFSKPISTGWFTFAKACELSLIDEDMLIYLINTSGVKNFNYEIVAELFYNDVLIEKPKVTNSSNTALISLYKEDLPMVKEAGSYSLRVYISPKEGSTGVLADGSEYKIFSSNFSIERLYKTEMPNVLAEKEDSGRGIKFTIEGLNEYSYEIAGGEKGMFHYDGDGKNSYILTSKSLEYTNTSRTIEIYAKQTQTDENVLVLRSEPYKLDGIKLLKVAPSNIKIKVKDTVSYFSYDASNPDVFDRYVFSLTHIDSNGIKTVIGSQITGVTNEIAFDSFFEETDYKKAGTYLLTAERYSTKVNELTGEPASYTIEKLAAPIYNDIDSTSEILYWSANDVAGYKILLNSVTVEENTVNTNLRISAESLKAGENIVEVYAFGTEDKIWSEPLKIKLYKFDSPKLEINQSVVGLANAPENITLSITFDIYYNKEKLKNFTTTNSKELNLLTLTKAEYFSKERDTTYMVMATIRGSSLEYKFVYGSVSEIEFTKLGIPSISMSNVAVEINGRSFFMKIDSREYIEYKTQASLTGAGSGKHKAYFYIAGDGKTSIDSNEVVKEFTI